MERLRCSGLVLGLRVGRHFDLDQVLWVLGFRVAAAVAAWRRAVVLVSRGGAPGWGVRVSWSWYAQKNGVASLGVAVRGLGLGLLDG